jgi:hypothetical protein
VVVTPQVPSIQAAMTVSDEPIHGHRGGKGEHKRGSESLGSSWLAGCLCVPFPQVLSILRGSRGESLEFSHAQSIDGMGPVDRPVPPCLLLTHRRHHHHQPLLTASHHHPTNTNTIALGHPEQQSRLRQYQVVGRHLPTEKEPTPTVYRMKIFAPNEVGG